MKKTVSLILCLMMFMGVIGTVAASAESLPLSAGKDALMSQFPDGACSGGLDYVYYSPVSSADDATKYPLVVWLHGRSSGTVPREQLYMYDFSNWSSAEYQARFADAGGAYLLLPRSDAVGNDWYDTMTGSIKATIDSFISLNKENIDTSRIYIMGYSNGGKMVYKMLSAYPDFFAAGVPICGTYNPTTLELDKMKNTSMWFLASENDVYVSSNATFVVNSYNYLSGITGRPEGVRMTWVAKTMWSDGSSSSGINREHMIWDTVIYDMHMRTGEQYLYTSTKDASGAAINFPGEEGVISWLSVQKLDESKETVSFFQRIINFFKSIFAFFAQIFG